MSENRKPPTKARQNADELRARLAKLAADDQPTSRHLGARLRNYFLTGLVIVGPVTITVYIIWWLINVVDAWIKPFVPKVYNPDTYLPFALPGIGLLFAIAVLTLIGALAANLLGRTLISYGELMLDRMPIVRNIYRGIRQIFDSVVTAAAPTAGYQKVGMIEFPSKGLWSIVFVTGEAAGEVAAARPGGETDLVSVFMPTGIVPPTGFVCFVPRASVIALDMSIEDAAKVIISGGMVTPPYRAADAGNPVPPVEGDGPTEASGAPAGAAVPVLSGSEVAQHAGPAGQAAASGRRPGRLLR